MSNVQEQFPLIAAIDLGSNSFHMVLARVDQGEIRILERLGEKSRWPAGFDSQGLLREEATRRGLDCLGRSAQLTNGRPQGPVPIAGTTTLGIARNPKP